MACFLRGIPLLNKLLAISECLYVPLLAHIGKCPTYIIKYFNVFGVDQIENAWVTGLACISKHFVKMFPSSPPTPTPGFAGININCTDAAARQIVYGMW